ncbi:methyltransferase, FxLD system [Streptomyces sp. NPDC004111]|uniref:methyltransferase, FxLD system n=1 Tax=Streptomyces sp. NPDC004111 TaxID=3364690 RepID=UPI0036B59D7D
MPTDRWHQHNITFADRETGHRLLSGRLGTALREAEAAGEISTWWFMNKSPWPLRYQAGQPSARIESELAALVRDSSVSSWTTTIYEPETTAFGGAQAIVTAHDLFHADSRHLSTYTPGPGRLGRAETTVLFLSAMMRAAGLDWFEQGDTWAKAAALRPAKAVALPPEKAAAMTPAMHRLMTVDAHSLCRPSGPLDGHTAWVAAFEHAGSTLARLASTGLLERGLRAVLAHHTIFHANRAALQRDDQHTLFNIAREAVMGSKDNTASPANSAARTTSVGAVNTTTLAAQEAGPDQLRNELVDKIRKDGYAQNPAVEDALRSVERHRFVPDTPLERAYANAPVNIKYDTDGTSISCASQPGVVALMLDQLDVQPGERILELGAGSGYNAALLAHLVGDAGHVTTIDVDEDLVAGARMHLASAGYTNVEALTRDGALGHAEGAPYDRIIATVGAHGVPHAWIEQLAPDGRLLVPQRLKGSVARSIAYEQRGGRWTSVSSKMNSFMPLRRGIADDDRRVIPLSSDGTVRLQAPASQTIDAAALASVLDQPRTEEWTGMTVRAMESPEWMELFVSCSLPSGLVRMLFPPAAKGTQLTEDPYPSSTAAVDKGAVTYLARRLLKETTPEGGRLWEFGVIGHGPGSEELAGKVGALIRTWDRDFRGREATFEIQRSDAPAVGQRPGLFALDTPLNRIVVNWQ